MKSLGLETWELASLNVFPDAIVDIRTTEQFTRAHLKGSVNITYNNFQRDALVEFAETEALLIVDEAGARAAEMAVWLRSRGIEAQYLVGGLAAWRGPLEKA